MVQEEYAIILEYLPYGYPLEKKRLPLAQAIGKHNFTLLQVVPRRGIKLEVGEEVYIGTGKREKIQYILGRCPREKLTENSKIHLKELVEEQVNIQEERFIKFFNEAEPINTRLHQLELLPGFGKKNAKAILDARESEPFKSFDDIRKRVPNIPDPRKSIEKRIYEELTNIERHNLFIQ